MALDNGKFGWPDLDQLGRSIERAFFVAMEWWLQLPSAARGGVLCVA